MTGVATCTLAGIAYGVSDPAMKDTLNLALVLATAATAAFQKFEAYARESVNTQEQEYRMFGGSPSGNEAQNSDAAHAV
jgi:hypothetical protein